MTSGPPRQDIRHGPEFAFEEGDIIALRQVGEGRQGMRLARIEKETDS
jgi:hypothetical protein